MKKASSVIYVSRFQFHFDNYFMLPKHKCQITNVNLNIIVSRKTKKKVYGEKKTKKK